MNRYQGRKIFAKGRNRHFPIRSMWLPLAKWALRGQQCFSYSLSCGRGQGAAGDGYSVARALAELNEQKCGNAKPC